MKEKTWEERYETLRAAVISEGCVIIDPESLGSCTYIDGHKAVICISASRSAEKRFYILSHEIGHLFTVKTINIGDSKYYKLVWRDVAGSEKEANKVVLKLLKIFSLDSSRFKTFYGGILKKRRSYDKM